MLANFKSILTSKGENFAEEKSENELKSENRLGFFFKNQGLKLSKKQKINFTEAALIKLFEPQYNVHFKNNFPDKKHKSYLECYDQDIRALIIELDMQNMKHHIYTEKSGRGKYYMQEFYFDNDFDRMFF
jgi:hypothetical protein